MQGQLQKLRCCLRLAEDQIELDRVAAIHRDGLALACRGATRRHDGEGILASTQASEPIQAIGIARRFGTPTLTLDLHGHVGLTSPTRRHATPDARLASTGRRLDSRRGRRGSCPGRSCWQGHRRGRRGATASNDHDHEKQNPKRKPHRMLSNEHFLSLKLMVTKPGHWR